MQFTINLKPRIPIINPPNDIRQTNIYYPLIEPYAYAHIFFSTQKYSLFYEVLEPTLSPDEKDILDIVSEGLKEILTVKLSELKNVDKIIEYLERNVRFILEEYDIHLDEKSFNKIMYYIFRNFYGYGRIEPLMHDPFIEDIECSGVGIPVYVVHRIFGNLETNIIFENEDEIKEIIEKFALRSGKHISYAEPLLDATLPDGSRVNATYSSDVTTRGPTFTIRKFRKNPWTPIDLIRLGTLTPEILAYFWLAIQYRRNIIIIGGTSSGKTTLLNAIAMFIPPNARIVSIEDTREIQLYHKNWIPAVVRYSQEQEREIDMFLLLKESFRQNPDYIIVGEVRGQEAYVMFQGMASGHAALTTMHATSVKSLIERLTTPPINLPKVLIELLDIVAIMQHDVEMGKNIRRLKEVDEIKTYRKYNWIFRWNPFNKAFEINAFSTVFEKISREYGISIDDLWKEWDLRRKLLWKLYQIGISDYNTLSKIISMYYLNKEAVLNYYNIA